MTAADPFGKAVYNFFGSIGFSCTDPGATLPPSYTFTAANAGVAVFFVTLSVPGPQTLTVTDLGTGIFANLVIP